MPKFSFTPSRIATLLGLFFISIIAMIAIDSISVATLSQTVATLERGEIAQRITSPGLTTPIGSPAPTFPPRANPGTPSPTPTTTPTLPPRSTPAPTIPPRTTPSPSPTAIPIPTTTPTPSPSESPLPIPVPAPRTPLPTPLPTTSPAPTPTPTTTPQVPINRTNRPLSPEERTRIVAYLRSRNISPNAAVELGTDARFILHDTSVLMAPSAIELERRLGRGPLGLGVNIFLPRNDGTVLTRPNFYELRRPTTTEFEKASDILPKPIRERYLRQVWSATDEDSKRQALDNALANMNLSSSEIAKEQREARAKLAASSGRIFTTATWSVEWICNRYNSGDRSVAIASRENSLRSACAPLTNYFNVRNSRVKSAVTAEIVQVGARSPRGNQTTCVASNRNIATLPNPPYSENQYNSLVANYLRSALAAGKYPQLTTHFLLDAFDPEGHCDPRCFNLNKLYSSIASTMAHPKGTTYGINPSYGTNRSTHNIWWNDRICHGSAP